MLTKINFDPDYLAEVLSNTQWAGGDLPEIRIADELSDLKVSVDSIINSVLQNMDLSDYDDYKYCLRDAIRGIENIFKDETKSAMAVEILGLATSLLSCTDNAQRMMTNIYNDQVPKLISRVNRIANESYEQLRKSGYEKPITTTANWNFAETNPELVHGAVEDLLGAKYSTKHFGWIINYNPSIAMNSNLQACKPSFNAILNAASLRKINDVKLAHIFETYDDLSACFLRLRKAVVESDYSEIISQCESIENDYKAALVLERLMFDADDSIIDKFRHHMHIVTLLAQVASGVKLTLRQVLKDRQVIAWGTDTCTINPDLVDELQEIGRKPEDAFYVWYSNFNRSASSGIPLSLVGDIDVNVSYDKYDEDMRNAIKSAEQDRSVITRAAVVEAFTEWKRNNPRPAVHQVEPGEQADVVAARIDKLADAVASGFMDVHEAATILCISSAPSEVHHILSKLHNDINTEYASLLDKHIDEFSTMDVKNIKARAFVSMLWEFMLAKVMEIE